jgi:hypothetical protein
MTSDELLLMLCIEHCDHNQKKGNPHDHWCQNCLEEMIEEFEEDLLERVALELEESDDGVVDVLDASATVRSFKK